MLTKRKATQYRGCTKVKVRERIISWAVSQRIQDGGHLDCRWNLQSRWRHDKQSCEVIRRFNFFFQQYFLLTGGSGSRLRFTWKVVRPPSRGGKVGWESLQVKSGTPKQRRGEVRIASGDSRALLSRERSDFHPIPLPTRKHNFHLKLPLPLYLGVHDFHLLLSRENIAEICTLWLKIVRYL